MGRSDFWVCIKKPSNSIWSVIQRLMLGAFVNFICQERNVILFDSKNRSVDVVLNIIVNTVRLKLLSLNLKWSRDVGTAAKVWHLPNLDLKGNNLFMDKWSLLIDLRNNMVLVLYNFMIGSGKPFMIGIKLEWSLKSEPGLES
ncbi:hypothetical protein Tco_1280563 [Tanacetum coccineum]